MDNEVINVTPEVTESTAPPVAPAKKRRKARLEKTYWGYIFIAPFFIAYLIFSAYPIFSTFFYAFTQRPDVDWDFEFVGLDNFYFDGVRETYFKNPATGEVMKRPPLELQGGFLNEEIWRDAFLNTGLMWIIGFIPQLGLALLLTAWFTDARIRVRGQGFFKVIFYMPNIMTAATIGFMFYAFSTPGGLIYVIAQNMSILEYGDPLAGAIYSRGIVAFINFWMWYGNTMIVLIAGVLGINPSLFEAANIDGANGTQVFWRITIPLIRPILTFTLVQSLIGGLQMFDVPYVITGFAESRHGIFVRTIMTQIRATAFKLNALGAGPEFGYSSAAAVSLFLLTIVLSIIIFSLMKDRSDAKYMRKQKKLLKMQAKAGGAH